MVTCDIGNVQIFTVFSSTFCAVVFSFLYKLYTVQFVLYEYCTVQFAMYWVTSVLSTVFTELIHIVVNCTGVRYTNKSPRIIFVIEDFPMRKIKVFSRIYKSLLVLCMKDPFQYIYFVLISITSSVLEWLFYKTNRRDICTLVDCKFSFDSNLKEIPNLFPASCVKKTFYNKNIICIFNNVIYLG